LIVNLANNKFIWATQKEKQREY